MTTLFGAIPGSEGVHFTVCAPGQQQLALVLDDGPEQAMLRDARGVFSLHVPGASAGQRYRLRTAQGLRPDPASRYQPEGPLGPSQVVDAAAFQWTDREWRGIDPPNRHVFYEMHVGTFTREGTFAAARERLSHLADVGITTIEVMPLAEFSGRFGWGYDGVLLFAPTRNYGTPDDVRRFVDEAHRLGMAVILDVVYNHFGPVGNCVPEFIPAVQGTPGEWGDSINYDGEGSDLVREFMRQNAAYWIRDFHFDGLRLDATQAIHDTSDEHIVSELCRVAREAAPERHVFIVGESESQDTRLLKGTGAYADGLDALWNEDWHHSAFVALTGRRQAYLTDYQGNAQEFASMARHGFLYQGQWYSWQKKTRGGFALGLPSTRIVAFLENHDQVANTGVGDRLYQEVQQARWRAMTALLLLGPQMPLIFQGAEFGSSRHFSYFADHEGELAAAVKKGRMEFLAQFPNLATPEMQAAVPDPAALATFEGGKLCDSERSADTPLLRLHRDLLALRRTDAILQLLGTGEVSVESSAPTEEVLLIRYVGRTSGRLLIVNFGDDYTSPMNDPLYAPRPGSAWSALWSSEQPQYGGHGDVLHTDAGPWLIRAASAALLAN